MATDGQTLAMGTGADSSTTTGINGSQAGSASTEAGATYLYQRSGATWSQRAYIKASNTDKDDRFGDSVALSGDGGDETFGGYRRYRLHLMEERMRGALPHGQHLHRRVAL